MEKLHVRRVPQNAGETVEMQVSFPGVTYFTQEVTRLLKQIAFLPGLV